MKQFDHIAYSTEDIPATVEFYQSRFPDTEILYQDATWALVQCSGIKIALVSPDQHPPHIAFRVETHDELIEEAEKAGSKIQVHRDRSESFYVRDPSGNTLEFVWYPETAE